MSEQSAVAEFRRSFRVSKFKVECVVTLIAGKPVSTRFEWEPYYPGVLVGQAFRQYRSVQSGSPGRDQSRRWLWQALDHRTGQVRDYVFGRRKDEVFFELKALLEPS